MSIHAKQEPVKGPTVALRPDWINSETAGSGPSRDPNHALAAENL
jgi:hypothetical protein